MKMRAYMQLISLVVLLQSTLGVRGFVSDDEEFMSEKSGSGSGCFEITTLSGICDCTIFHSCLETCSHSQCEHTLGDCFTQFRDTGKCGGQSNETSFMNKSTKDGSETTWIVGGSALAAVLVAASVVMLALRKKSWCCRRKCHEENNGTPQAIVYQPNALYQTDHDEYSTIQIETIAGNSHQNGTYTKEETQSMITNQNQKLIRQVSNSSNDYQLMPDFKEVIKINGGQETTGLHMHTIKEEKTNNKPTDNDHMYQPMTDLHVQYCNHYQTMNESQSSDKNECDTYYQPMADGNDRASQNYMLMEDSSGIQADDEYTVMEDAHDRKRDVYDNSATSGNIYYGNDVGGVYSNEPIKGNLTPKSSNVCQREDEVYERIEC